MRELIGDWPPNERALKKLRDATIKGTGTRLEPPEVEALYALFNSLRDPERMTMAEWQLIFPVGGIPSGVPSLRSTRTGETTTFASCDSRRMAETVKHGSVRSTTGAVPKADAQTQPGKPHDE